MREVTPPCGELVAHAHVIGSYSGCCEDARVERTKPKSFSESPMQIIVVQNVTQRVRETGLLDQDYVVLRAEPREIGEPSRIGPFVYVPWRPNRVV